MNRYFRATSIEKTADVDHPEHGCSGRPSLLYYNKVNITALTFAELVRKCKEYVSYEKPDDKYAFMPEGVESEYFGFNQHEDGGGYPASMEQIAEWKVGKRVLYCCDYTVRFEVVVEDKLTEADLVGLVTG